MADKNSLGLVGLIFASVTVGVMLVAGLVVRDHVTGRLALEPAHSVAEISATRLR
jgi:hypothetical protein